MAQKTTDGIQTARRAIRKTRTTKAGVTLAKRGKPKAPAAVAIQPAHEVIARRAYDIWQTEMGQAHEPTQHWAAAQVQLRKVTKRSAAGPRRAGTAEQPGHGQIAKRAYEIWQAAVGRANDAARHWAEAESQLRAELSKFSGRRRGASSLEPTREMIARRAYEIWQAAVRGASEPTRHWIQAESQLRSEMKKPAARRAPRKARPAAPAGETPAAGRTPRKGPRLAA